MKKTKLTLSKMDKMNTALNKRKEESYKIFDKIAPTYDALNLALSMGVDKYWRTKFLKHLPQSKNIKALDLATGTGDVPLVLIKDSNVNHVTGNDLSSGMIKYGREKIKKKKKEDQIHLTLGDAMNIKANDNSYDLVTISFGIRNFSDPFKSLCEIQRVLKPGGRLLILEFSMPSFWAVRIPYLLYFRFILPLIGNFFSKHKDAYKYLNQTVEQFPYGQEFTNLLTKAGLNNAKYTEYTFGLATMYQGDK
ncbi:MAG: bifunctional demethylmenaquinone methyltransferase/2-methoxy-6-polyprenyl-1,4-benzoquinol methylase UbiE [Bdellovibrionales bacterium]|nr:bifunctional demethylmenaquinone methyltransferase/2-methoxy-6-polyprenyl-1,4-benzoquinol methylase UbiE [Bdellovibrionales bacterium]